jgi:hypothetical protein
LIRQDNFGEFPGKLHRASIGGHLTLADAHHPARSAVIET